jgi:tellurite resistance protein TerC
MANLTSPLITQFSHSPIFTFESYWSIYLFFTFMVACLIIVDLKSSAKKIPSFRQSLIWSLIWISAGVTVGISLYFYTLYQIDDGAVARRITAEYFAGYLMEKILAIDNIFVFILIFKSLHISLTQQKRVLFYGVLGAIFFRACFIAIGAYWFNVPWVMKLFGSFLLLSGIKMIFDHYHHFNQVNIERTPKMISFLSKYLPVTHQSQSDEFFIKEDSQWLVTPLFISLLAIEFSDIVFAFDSVPAIFALTNEPLVVFTSNIAAILGLRSIYFLLIDMMDRFTFLGFGLSGILIFVGIKMLWLNELYSGHFPLSFSTGIIFLFLLVSLLASLIFPPKKIEHAS